MQELSSGQLVSASVLYIDGMPGGRPPVKPQPKFGERLALFRKQRNISQARFAKMLGFSREMVTYYERRAKNPTAEFILKAAEILGVSVNELLGTECKPTRKPGPPSQLETRLEEVRKLPRQRQKLALDLLDTILRDPGRANGHKQAA